METENLKKAGNAASSTQQPLQASQSSIRKRRSASDVHLAIPTDIFHNTATRSIMDELIVPALVEEFIKAKLGEHPEQQGAEEGRLI